mgnify:FL=1
MQVELVIDHDPLLHDAVAVPPHCPGSATSIKDCVPPELVAGADAAHNEYEPHDRVEAVHAGGGGGGVGVGAGAREQVPAAVVHTPVALHDAVVLPDVPLFEELTGTELPAAAVLTPP